MIFHYDLPFFPMVPPLNKDSTAIIGKLHGIIQKNQHELAKPPIISLNRQRPIKIHAQLQIFLRRRRPLLANGTGGLSGPAVFPVAVRMVWQTARAVKIPVVGMGGVSSAEDVLEMMMAGATAVEIGAANLRDPYACRDIILALPEAMARYGIEDLNEIIGAAQTWEKM